MYLDFINPKFTSDCGHNTKCIYCKTELSIQKIDQILDVCLSDIKRRFNGHRIIMENIHGSFDKNYFRIISDLNYDSTILGSCLVCGWWKILERYWMGAEWQMWDVFFGLNGSLKNLDYNKSNLPLSEVRNYLVRNYENRFNVNPRLFEELVADVYRDFGYQTICTGYSNDGGIDVILIKDDLTVGIQVKRSKNKIKLEQIRSLLGALMISGYKTGMFVCASDFQRGVYSVAEQFSIELINGNRFYNQLKEAQIIRNQISNIDLSNIKNLYYDDCYPMNSL
ncbi:restriction endonuclease [Flavobacterium sp. S87F.05.LMB.W.Kidney.N]|uniref:restriction endonuclease n=1 Tax=Flavobacterium sp. S87F.05.LMB.W.Kidney.N TaxID=1278758 RepID=UPI00106516BC|nr:restriction endonuclease [Flavobacterium sp. S87F.05.LMB.W.Kidney.N]TDX09466.1 restriction system protein [Flavobacterium sp. S87F.05.LMB.W.Kidney.N]